VTAPPLKRPVLTCRRKKRHPDEFTARAAAMSAIEQHDNAKVLYIYRCPECRGWHLTRRNNGVLVKVTADNPVHERAAA
jgi:hypothetical protein